MKKFLMILIMMFVLGGISFVVSAESLTIYPDYPEIVTKDSDYKITVSQGSRTETLNVYSMCRQTGTAVLDNYRRFAEFEFDGTVQIKITSEVFDMSSAQIMPKEVASKAVYANGELIITLDKNYNFAVNVNKDYRTTIGIFAEAPETDVPDKNDPAVVYYEAGYHDTDEVVKLTSGKTLYLEPGAILDANIRADGDDITVKGKGIIRDKLYGTAEKLTPVLRINDKAKNIKIEGIKFLDSKTFVLVGNFGNSNVHIDNVKILSNKANSDAISFWSSPSNIKVNNSYIFIADNVFVFNGKCDNVSFENCIVGTNAAVVAFSKQATGSISVKDIDVFVAGLAAGTNMGLVINNAYETTVDEGRSYEVDGLVVENVDASYCKAPIRLFAGNGLTDDKKNFVFKNIALPGGSIAGIRVLSGGGYNFNLQDVWYGSSLVTSKETANLKDDGNGSTQIRFSRNNNDIKVFINDYMVKFDTQPILKDGRTLVPIRAISTTFGADVIWDEATQKVTIKVADKTIVLPIGSQTATVNGQEKILDVPAQVINDRTYVPLRFVSEAFETKVNWIEETETVAITSDVFAVYKDEAANKVTNGTELLDNSDFEKDLSDKGLYGIGWEAHNDSKITVVKDKKNAQQGDSFLKVSERKHGYSGVRQVVLAQLAANGPGKYKLSAYVRAASATSSSIGQKFHMTIAVNASGLEEQKNTSKFFEMSAEWQKIENEVELQWEGELSLGRIVIVGTKDFTDDFYVDNFTFTKVE